VDNQKIDGIENNRLKKNIYQISSNLRGVPSPGIFKMVRRVDDVECKLSEEGCVKYYDCPSQPRSLYVVSALKFVQEH
jgi:hypothetical protein